MTRLKLSPPRNSRSSSLLYQGAFRAAGSLGACREEETIVVTGVPRSGTTLVQETLQELPDYKTLNEPLLHKSVQKAHGFTSRTYLSPDAVAPQQRRFLKQTLSGKLGATARWSQQSDSRWQTLQEHAKRRKLLVKFCRLNRMLPWFCQNFQTKGIVLVIRHPCSVVSSMLKYGQWDFDFRQRIQESDSPLRLDNLPDETRSTFEPVVAAVQSLEEMLAAIWALDYYIPLRHIESPPWLLLPYERLVKRGEAELVRVTHGLDVPITTPMRQRLHRPSSSVKGKLRGDADSQLSKWKSNLRPEQIDRILNIVELAGLSEYYTDALEPDYDALNTHQSPSFQWH
ncbi:sulfotransferase [Pelagicoccus sp. SDUM812002]|uniref:sulfotransferase n=1 Tax=Pelagicoccus sp. SDUM812002 TaxID=3041266 RepID=UPI00280C8998|nr:sulfotransferase [Pelagicoccus sp. SDUM812002]MDQ8184962.1 sulfotransferase [Pelagicoccus sp. SDUM812002]